MKWNRLKASLCPKNCFYQFKVLGCSIVFVTFAVNCKIIFNCVTQMHNKNQMWLSFNVTCGCNFLNTLYMEWIAILNDVRGEAANPVIVGILLTPIYDKLTTTLVTPWILHWYLKALFPTGQCCTMRFQWA